MRKKKNQLASGSFRVQASYYDDAGKRHLKSFTAPTRAQAIALKEEWENLHGNGKTDCMTVSEAVARYIRIKEGVLSPSTIRSYYAIHRLYLSGAFGDYDIDKLTNDRIQVFISDLARRVSPKTVRNTFAVLSATLKLNRPDFAVNVTLPQKIRPTLYCPSDNDVRTLLEQIQGTQLERAVLLAAFGPLRRGEICALSADDLRGNVLTVNKSMVMDNDGYWTIKTTKTTSSIRTIMLPPFVAEKMPKHGKIVDYNPNALSMAFRRAMRASGLTRFRFHDLRHYCASIMHAQGIADVYIQARGGWSSNSVLRSVYVNTIDTEQAKQDAAINDHFAAILKP